MGIKRLYFLGLLMSPSLVAACPNTGDFHVESSFCIGAIPDADKALLMETKDRIETSVTPDFPKSLPASMMAYKAEGKDEMPVNIGCVALRFSITNTGKPEDIEVIASKPEGVFERSAIQALNKFTFMKEPGTGVHVFTYQIGD